MAKNVVEENVAPQPAGDGPAVWYVTNGSAVVGPVDTGLLLRGITLGRVPSDSLVAREHWPVWRDLENIREVRALRRLQRSADFSLADIRAVNNLALRPMLTPAAAMFAGARDVDEVLKTLLSLSVRATRASFGLIHRSLPPHIGLVTTHGYGRHLRAQLGHVVPWHDPVRELALDDATGIGSPLTDAWARASRARLAAPGQDVAWVAAMPLVFDRGHRGLLELARLDHSFRETDVPGLERLREFATLRIDQLRFQGAADETWWLPKA